MNNIQKDDEDLYVIKFWVKLILIIIFIISFIITLWLIIGPKYDIWEQEQSGKAELSKAESTRRITVLEAQAKLDSAKLLGQAEIERAKGVAQANKIIGDSLKDNESYLHYLWINNMTNTGKETVYIPTEANLPILEAGRHK